MCGVGLYGISKDNIKLIRTFAIYYWVNVVVNIGVIVACSIFAFKRVTPVCKTEVDFGSCHKYYFAIALSSVIVSSIFAVINVFGAFVIWSYYRQSAIQNSYYSLNRDQDYDEN
ncbi:hypothetical protein K493DRAFT_298672 [Basidiobolus meristosporus CBS 931.73]|uniref:Uncharacterized protein n=1 Tax=Basidiobolus meristosporus CBS 931.73 TaxID=1314790 RepID=A0A1Y1YSA8_9FUNG|nr:hypothetical protein K493DRAFT_298672 [Basidiobolus meristosporus CBS 931.73]|eukprot:ORY00859.1 hypothetical protein K493DRAFT_298672 [Basidiobolus meristosporus CBS 931.73]